MSATVTGAPTSANRMRRVSSDTSSDFHYFCFLPLQQIVNLRDVVVVELLQVLLAVLDVVFRNLVELLQLVAPFGARVANPDSRFFGELVYDLNKISAPLFVQRGNGNSDDSALRHRVEAEVGFAKAFLYRLRETLVPRRHGEKPRLRGGDARNLVERHRLTERIDSDSVEEIHGGFSRPDRR